MSTEREALRAAIDALEEIALAGMSGSGQESEEGMRDWHARRAWQFISIAARALETVRQAAQAAPSLPPVQVGAEARSQLVEMDWSVEGMKPLDGMDYIMADYARTFGRTPDAFMADIVAKTKQRLFVWWGAHREAIRAALAAQEPPPPEPKKFWYMRDNHTFRQLAGTPAEMVAQALEEFDAGHTYGSVFIRPGSFAAHAAGEARRDEFTKEALTLLEAHAAVTPPDPPAATPARSANQGEAP